MKFMRMTIVSLFLLKALDAQAMCVSSDTAYLRSGPGANYSLSWTVGKYTPLVILEQRAGWYQVQDVDGSKHWAEQRTISKKMKCATVKVLKASLRTGPGTKYPYAAYQSADKYFPFKILNQKDSWMHVSDAAGNKFWVHNSNLWRPRKVSVINF